MSARNWSAAAVAWGACQFYAARYPKQVRRAGVEAANEKMLGEALFDRLLGAGAIATKTVVLICLVGVMFERLDMFVDIAVGYAILNFIGNLAIAKYFMVPKPDGHLPVESP